MFHEGFVAARRHFPAIRHGVSYSGTVSAERAHWFPAVTSLPGFIAFRLSLPCARIPPFCEPRLDKRAIHSVSNRLCSSRGGGFVGCEQALLSGLRAYPAVDGNRPYGRRCDLTQYGFAFSLYARESEPQSGTARQALRATSACAFAMESRTPVRRLGGIVCNGGIGVDSAQLVGI
jgi:hypothetical protein